MGTGPFAVPTLRRLHASPHEVAAVVTRPPRGRRPQAPPMQEAADGLGLPVLQPETVNCDEFRATLEQLKPELLVVCDYGEILKPATLAVTPLGGVNLHGSLLPKFRGAAPVQWAVLKGESETGNTVIQMTPGLDAGPCLGVQRVAIDPDETAGELEERLAEQGGELVLQVVDQLQAGTAAPIEQNASLSSKAPRLTKEHGSIDWSQPALTIKNQVRALQPWPRTFTFLHSGDTAPQRLIVHRAEVIGESDSDLTPPATGAASGTVLHCQSRLIVATGDRPLEILELQPPGKRRMSADEFLRGHALRQGDTLAAS